jgi:hypothetical protein
MSVKQILSYASEVDKHVENFIKLYNFCEENNIASFSYTYVDKEYVSFMKETEFKVDSLNIVDFIVDKISQKLNIPHESLDQTDAEITFYRDTSVHTYYAEREIARNTKSS